MIPEYLWAELCVIVGGYLIFIGIAGLVEEIMDWLSEG